MLPSTAPPTTLVPFFSPDPTTTEIYTLSLHDALPICRFTNSGRKNPSTCCRKCAPSARCSSAGWIPGRRCSRGDAPRLEVITRSEEHTSELQSLAYLVCRLLLEKKKQSKRRRAGYQRS